MNIFIFPFTFLSIYDGNSDGMAMGYLLRYIDSS